MEKTIEIPFGAFDSELKGGEYTIPQGMRARIEGNKVILEPKESEDEKIRKNIITFLDELFSLGKNTNFDKWSKSDCAEWIAWMEKQGEQNPAWSEQDEANLQFAIDDFQFCVYNNQFPVVYNTEKHKEVLASLKSLKERCTWKPSDGQMQALELVVQYHAFANTDNREKIVALFNDLKKLKR